MDHPDGRTGRLSGARSSFVERKLRSNDLFIISIRLVEQNAADGELLIFLKIKIFGLLVNQDHQSIIEGGACQAASTTFSK